jgi:hypothetical protein
MNDIDIGDLYLHDRYMQETYIYDECQSIQEELTSIVFVLMPNEAWNEG